MIGLAGKKEQDYKRRCKNQQHYPNCKSFMIKTGVMTASTENW
jgi:hypothetical protein